MEPTRIEFLIGGLVVLFVSVSFIHLALRFHFGSVRTASYWIMRGVKEGTFLTMIKDEIPRVSTYTLTEIFTGLWGLILGLIFCLGSIFYLGFLHFYRPVLMIGLGGTGMLIGLAEMIKKENYGLYKLRGMGAILEGGFFLLVGSVICVVGILAWIKG